MSELIAYYIYYAELADEEEEDFWCFTDEDERVPYYSAKFIARNILRNLKFVLDTEAEKSYT